MAGIGHKIRLHLFDFHGLGQVIQGNNRHGPPFGKVRQLFDMGVKFLVNRFLNVKNQVFRFAFFFQNPGNRLNKIV